MEASFGGIRRAMHITALIKKGQCSLLNIIVLWLGHSWNQEAVIYYT